VSDLSLRGKVAVVGTGETTYYKRGQSPDDEIVLMLKAILAACEDAGISPKEIDGFSSYADDRNAPSRLFTALGGANLRFSNMQWGAGGGGAAGSVGNAAAAIAAGTADVVVAYRGLAQGQFGRFGAGRGGGTVSGPAALTLPYGLMSPAQTFAMRVNRLFHERAVSPDTQKAVALAAYHHAQSNPRAVMYGRPLTADGYDDSRWIVEPFRLFDCCLENDGAAAIVLTSAERARDITDRPVYVLAAQQNGPFRTGAPHNQPDYATSCFKESAPRLFAQAGVTPADVDVAQSYENFTGGVVMALIEHGFCSYEEANDFFTFENLVAPSGALPLNTSGGNLAECYMHGLCLVIEGVRQVRGTSTNQVPDVDVSFVNSGPMVDVVTSIIFGSEEALG
jgi:acetyl-CoA acetyltransferase